MDLPEKLEKIALINFYRYKKLLIPCIIMELRSIDDNTAYSNALPIFERFRGKLRLIKRAIRDPLCPLTPSNIEHVLIFVITSKLWKQKQVLIDI